MEERSEAEVVKEEEKAAEKAKEPEKPGERKVTAKEVIVSLAEKVSELEQRLSQQQQLIEAMRSTFLQYQQVLDQISEAVKSFQQASQSPSSGAGEVGSGLLMWLLRSFLSGESSGSDKLMRMFLTETLKTNIALQRILLHGIARGLGVSLKQVVRKSKEEEEEEEEEEGKR